MRLRASPKDVLRVVVVLVLGGMALGALITLVVVGAGKLGLELLPTVEMRLFIATTAWFSLLAWAATIAGFGFAAVQLVRKAPGALWGWLAGFVASVITQAAETAVAARAGAEIDTSGIGILAILALMGWGIFTIEKGWRPTLPPGASRR
ncbi:MAG: hypothetical protein BGN86_12785 [Caulobacterales bacterium 68-7]|nr:hypothetical protein [Caulobacterales bacterium]OJU12490.1 MAG: hypothetical protein BGN86_12785 [Caulobacterales bacterium 68-7]